MKIDLTPLYRNSIGFDNLVSMLDATSGSDSSSSGYPPYNIEVTGENLYAISLAVAGFKREEFDIQVEKGVLTITGQKTGDDSTREFLYQGIAARSFERKFNLADHIEVTGAAYQDGLLTISLEKHIPEAMKPKRIQISDTDKVLDNKAE